jgi:hypothetical protein
LRSKGVLEGKRKGYDKDKDESDYYPIFQQKEVRAVMEGYIGKPNSNPTIVLVSTPKAPGGLMQQIELEEDSLYHKLFFDYHYGLEGSMNCSILG